MMKLWEDFWIQIKCSPHAYRHQTIYQDFYTLLCIMFGNKKGLRQVVREEEPLKFTSFSFLIINDDAMQKNISCIFNFSLPQVMHLEVLLSLIM